MKPEIIAMFITMGICLIALLTLHIMKIIYYIKCKKEEEKRKDLFKKKG